MIGEWQEEYPEEPGYYWIRLPDKGGVIPAMLRIHEGGSRMVVALGHFFYRDDIEAFWSVRLEMPGS